MTDALSALTSLVTPGVIFYMFVGVLIGFIIGALPGLSATMAIAILTPVTFWLEPAAGFSMLIGVWNSAIFAGGVSAILINTPGTPASFMQTLDGYAMYKQGRGGLALGINVIYSAFGGLVSILALSILAFPIARFAVKFGPTEYFALALFGLCMMITISGGNILKGMAMGFAGILVATIGLDPITAVHRYTFGQASLLNGISYIAIMIGMFGIGEVLFQISQRRQHVDTAAKEEQDANLAIGRIIPTRKEFKDLALPSLVAAVIGIVVGAVPAAGGNISTIIAWGQGKKMSKHPEEYGKGSVEGLAVTSVANNATIGGAMITMLTLGIPGDTVSAIMIGALTMYGMTPGVKMFSENVDFVYKIIWLSIFASLVFLVFGLATAKATAKMLRIKQEVVWTMVCVFCIVGSYAIQNSFTDVIIMIIGSIVGYFAKKHNYPIGPLILGMILGPMMESNLRRALILSHNSLSIFVTRPVTVVILLLIVIAFSWGPISGLLGKKKAAEEKPEMVD